MIEYQGTHNNMPYKVTFNEQMGFRCGYVGIPKYMSLYKVPYDHIPILLYNCHGGLTYSGFFDVVDDEFWYLGYDCGHYCDGIDLASVRKYCGDNDAETMKNSELYKLKKDKHAYTLDECLEMCFDMIDQIVNYELSII